MFRLAIIGAIIAVAFILYSLVDAAMSDASRARGVSKPVWVVLIVALPVIGAVLWFVIGRGRGPAPAPVRAPDDDPRFTGTRMSNDEIDAHVEELEARLRELDEETFPADGVADLGASGGAANATDLGVENDADPLNRGDEVNGGDSTEAPDPDTSGEPR